MTAIPSITNLPAANRRPVIRNITRRVQRAHKGDDERERWCYDRRVALRLNGERVR